MDLLQNHIYGTFKYKLVSLTRYMVIQRGLGLGGMLVQKEPKTEGGNKKVKNKQTCCNLILQRIRNIK